MNKIRTISALLCLCALLLPGLAGCSQAGGNYAPEEERIRDMEMAEGKPENTAEGVPAEDRIPENPWVSAAETPVSTFSADVDTASYTLFRKLVNRGYSLDSIRESFAGQIRTEEMVNYFDYTYPQPAQGELFGVKSMIAPCPWDADSQLLILGLASSAAEVPAVRGNNLVFLIDVSGSMAANDKLELLKTAFSTLTDRLTAADRVSIVTYSGKEAVVLEGCPGDRKEEILNAIRALRAEGVTNGQAGLQKAYQTALSNFIDGGNNRIIMASDGDLNVGISSPEELKAFVTEKKNAGVYLSVLGFGSGNYRDGNMEALADHGNGSYYYIDGESEAERIFSDELFSTLYTVAEDVKLQLTFNPETVEEYRLVGYENRMLSKEDFEDDTKDAGELGAGHQVTVCYQLRLKDPEAELDPASELAKLAVRWKTPGYLEGKPETGASLLQETAVCASALTATPDGDFTFAAAVAHLSLLLRGSSYVAPNTGVSEILASLRPDGSGGSAAQTNYWREEFLGLLEKLIAE